MTLLLILHFYKYETLSEKVCGGVAARVLKVLKEKRMLLEFKTLKQQKVCVFLFCISSNRESEDELLLSQYGYLNGVSIPRVLIKALGFRILAV